MNNQILKLTGIIILITLMCTSLINILLFLMNEDLTDFWKMYIIMPLIGLGAMLIAFITNELVERL